MKDIHYVSAARGAAGLHIECKAVRGSRSRDGYVRGPGRPRRCRWGLPVSFCVPSHTAYDFKHLGYWKTLRAAGACFA